MCRSSVRRFASSATAVAIAGALGCGAPQTSVTHTWAAPVPPASAPMRRVLVLAANMNDKDRRAFEDAFVQRFARYGVVARASYELFPEQLPDPATARRVAEEARVEGVLVVTNRSEEKVTKYVPGSYPGDFWGGYYGTPSEMRVGAYTPDYVAITDVRNLETTLWDTRVQNGRLVWSASTRSTEPESGGKVTKSVVDKVVPEIARADLIPREGG